MIFIFKKMGKYMSQVVFSLIIKALGTIADLVLPFLLAHMIDKVLPTISVNDYSYLIYIGLFMFLVALSGWL